MTVHRFARDTLTATPWKNGGGVTREIVCWPPGAGMDRFDWRISIAHIASDGPFSAFAGVDRVITLLEGAGVRLHTADHAIDHRLDTPLAPFAFAGEAPIQADLLNGDCHDFNVMTRRAVCHADVSVQRIGARLPTAGQGLLLAMHGEWQVCAQDASGATHDVHLAPGSGLWWRGADLAWATHTSNAGAALLAVHIKADTAGGGTPT